MVDFGHYLLVPGFAGLCGVLTTHPLAAVDSLPYLLYRLHSYRETLVRLNRGTNPAALFCGQSSVFQSGDGEQPMPPVQRALVVLPSQTLALLAARSGPCNSLA